MYNEEIKKQFLDRLKNGMSYRNIFNKTKELEEEEQTDLYNIPTEVAMKYLASHTNITSLTTVQQKARAIQTYKRWAIKENFVDENNKYFEPINDFEQLYKDICKVTIFKTPRELIEAIDEHLYRRSEHGINSDEIIMAYMMLSYQGFQKDEICQIKIQDVSLVNEHMTIKNQRIALEIYEEFIGLLSKIYNYRTYSKISIYDDSSVDMNEYFISMGNKEPKEVEKRILRFAGTRIFNNIKFTVKDVYVMGQIYRAKLFNKSYEEFYKQLKKDMGGKFSPGYRKKLETMYDNW